MEGRRKVGSYRRNHRNGEKQRRKGKDLETEIKVRRGGYKEVSREKEL